MTSVRVLLSAYACAPGEGSEPEVGYRALLAAAAEHDVWLLTRPDNLRRLQPVLDRMTNPTKIHPVVVEPGWEALATKRALGKLGEAWHYYRWQRLARRTAIELDRRVKFDVVHHVTYATYWTPAGVAALHRKFVWGPVGGGTRAPWRLLQELGLLGVGHELVRMVAQQVLPLLWGAVWRQRLDTTVLVQNEATARRLGRLDAIVMSNATAVDIALQTGQGSLERNGDVVVVGRLIPLKGGVLATRMLKYLNGQTKLIFFGEGPDSSRIQRAARRWGVADRVVLAGKVEREDLLDHVRRAGVLLHPALRDEAGLAVAEALTLGTPVVSLAGTAPAQLTRLWPETPSISVAVGSPDQTARRLAAAVSELLAASPPVPAETQLPTLAFRDVVLSCYMKASGPTTSFPSSWNGA